MSSTSWPLSAKLAARFPDTVPVARARGLRGYTWRP